MWAESGVRVRRSLGAGGILWNPPFQRAALFPSMKCASFSRLKMSLQAHNLTLFNTSREEEAAAAAEDDILSARNKVTYVSFYLHRPSTAAVFAVSYLLIFLVCLAGNGVVCFIVLRGRNMRSVTNVFILNLAVSDLLVGIFCMPTTLLDNIITGKYSLLPTLSSLSVVEPFPRSPSNSPGAPHRSGSEPTRRCFRIPQSLAPKISVRHKVETEIAGQK